VQSYVTPHIEGKRYTNIGGSWAATIFSVKFHFFFYSVTVYMWNDTFLIKTWGNYISLGIAVIKRPDEGLESTSLKHEKLSFPNQYYEALDLAVG
jgi:hypothetical protein